MSAAAGKPFVCATHAAMKNTPDGVTVVPSGIVWNTSVCWPTIEAEAEASSTASFGLPSSFGSSKTPTFAMRPGGSGLPVPVQPHTAEIALTFV
jgi:hypothetical protein